MALPANARVIEEAAFQNCAQLTGILRVPETVKEIGPYAFAGCTGFTGTPVIPDGVERIGAHAFDGCTGLSGTLYLPEAIEVDATAFANCPNLTVVRGVPMHVGVIAENFVEGDFNYLAYEGAKEYCDGHDVALNRYAVDDGQYYKAVKDAVEMDGCNVIVMAGFGYADTIISAQKAFPNVRFIGLDISQDDLGGKPIGANTWFSSYREEYAGFMAGYAAVKLGYRHLGFLGGMDIPPVNRYGSGFIHGANQAATELKVADQVIIESSYAGTFQPDASVTRRMDRWYQELGVQVVFACGGNMGQSVAEAAKNARKAGFDANIIGVDADQSLDFGAEITVTSAMKGIAVSVRNALEAIGTGRWEAEYAGRAAILGMVSPVPEQNYLQLSPSTRFGAGFERADYEALAANLYNGTYSPEGDVAVTVRDPDAEHIGVIADMGGFEPGTFNAIALDAAQTFCNAHGYALSAYSADEGEEYKTFTRAASDGCTAVLLTGFEFQSAIAQAQRNYPDVRIIGLDMTADYLSGNIGKNTWLASYRADQAGFMAGYAVVKLGYRHLGFLGAHPYDETNQYGQGFVHGANQAAAELKVTDQTVIEYGYARQYSPDPAITERMNRWYQGLGVEVVFAACGGGGQSVAPAAREAGAKVIGVDTDQAALLGEDVTLTSAMKGMGVSALAALNAIEDGRWEAEFGGEAATLGMVSAVPEENYAQLAPSTQYGTGFTRADYEALTAKLFNGTYSTEGSVSVTVHNPDGGERVAVITNPLGMSEDEYNAAQDLKAKYGSEIVTATWPDDFYENEEGVAESIAAFAEDSSVGAIVVCQAVPGTAEGFRRIKKARPDIICIAGEPQEDLAEINAAADLVALNDFVSRGYLIVKTAKELGCDTLLHVSFQRHLDIDSIRRRLNVMTEAGRDLGVEVVSIDDAPDPWDDKIGNAVSLMQARVPELVAQYGTKTAFFTTNDGLVFPIIEGLLENGGYFIESDIPSPMLGFPEALDLNTHDLVYEHVLHLVETALVNRGAADRFATWAYPYTYSLVCGLGEHARNAIDGEADLTDMGDLAAALKVYTPEAAWNGACLTDPASGKATENCLLLYQDTYVMGDPGHFMGNTDVVIPDKYYRIAG